MYLKVQWQWKDRAGISLEMLGEVLNTVLQELRWSVPSPSMMHGEQLGISRFKWCEEKQTAHCSNFSENSSVLVFGWPILRLRSSAYLIFVIFFTLADFEAWKFYTQKCINLRQNSVNYTLCVNLHTVYMKLHSVCKITHCMSNYTLCVKLHTV